MIVKTGIMKASLSKYSDTLRKNETHEITQVITGDKSYIIDNMTAFETKELIDGSWVVSSFDNSIMVSLKLYIEDNPSSDEFVAYIMGANPGDIATHTWATPLTKVLDSLDDTYPVGAIFTTVNPNFDPNVELGGTWQKYDESNKIEWLRTA